MRCPWCGSPVIIQDNFWECGYCGDCGDLASGEKEHAYKSNDFIKNVPDRQYREQKNL